MLGTSTRTSNVLINLGLKPLRWLREVGSPQFGLLSTRAPPSPRRTALTAASCEHHGAAPNFGTESSGEIVEVADTGCESGPHCSLRLTLKTMR